MTATNMRNGLSGSNGASEHTFEFEFHSPDFHTPEDVVQYTHAKLDLRLRKFGRRVQGVIVHMRDLNGPKGGLGISCHVEARLAGLEPVNVAEEAQDLRAAIDLAIDRLTLVVGRHVDRARTTPIGRGARLARNSKMAQ
jgi:hypothetical protein